MIIIAEIVVRTDSGIPISAVETLSSTVNTTIKNAVDNTMISGLYRFCVPNDPHSITGSTGSTQGASTLSIHARNEIIRREKDILKGKEDIDVLRAHYEKNLNQVKRTLEQLTKYKVSLKKARAFVKK